MDFPDESLFPLYFQTIFIEYFGGFCDYGKKNKKTRPPASCKRSSIL